MTAPDCEATVNQILADAGLRTHQFFTPQPAAAALDPQAAWEVARAWGEITKAFMFTTIASLGTLAAELAAEPAPATHRLTALQTGFRVIGDDLVNLNPVFGKSAPDGVAGIHYLWWVGTVLQPLADVLPAAAADARPLPPGVRGLLDNMDELARSPIGAAVQLRVVEDIAFDIATAFRALFRQVTAAGTALFDDADLTWIDAHIEAEVMHRSQVSDDETGMTTIAATPAEQQQLLTTISGYATNWARALDDLAAVPAYGAS